MASPELSLLQDSDSELDLSLTTLENFLGLLGFCHYTFLRATLSWVAFLFFAVALPLFAVELLRCAECDKFEIETFELNILVSHAIVAAVSLLCVSRNLRKYGIRKALFVNRRHGHMAQFRKQYIHKIRVFYCLLISWFGICFVLKASREVARFMYLHHGPWWLPFILFFARLFSWSYSTLVFLSGCALFHLVGNLQIIHFENYGEFLERDLDVSVYIEEHMNLAYETSKISHRFRIFLLLEFLIITASQIMALLQATENQGIINFINGGDFAVLSIVQLVGIVLCLNAAAKISHRAQSLGSISSRWHALVTCNSNDVFGSGILDNSGNAEVCPHAGSLSVNCSESDLESSTDYMPLPANVHVTSSTSSYNRRQAFGGSKSYRKKQDTQVVWVRYTV
ncbi:hypothetical protein PHJA_000942500 [Phtheirospermum japonicum]|uniref:Uncharacterized protein n=1 Tax=Phtheirospermum japonicum TaxID=374723 RepID=A0A830BST1_9LAMI|nr:hypothetical protein PHJA_000942500 [Phtheirospermum japonicum]